MQKLVEFERVVGAEMKEEEEPEGETTVDPGGEALRPLGMNIMPFSSKSSLFSGIFGQQPPS